MPERLRIGLQSLRNVQGCSEQNDQNTTASFDIPFPDNLIRSDGINPDLATEVVLPAIHDNIIEAGLGFGDLRTRQVCSKSHLFGSGYWQPQSLANLGVAS